MNYCTKCEGWQKNSLKVITKRNMAEKIDNNYYFSKRLNNEGMHTREVNGSKETDGK